MRTLYLLFCCLIFASAIGQRDKIYVFRVELSDSSFAPEFIDGNGALVYNGDDPSERAFFSKYVILDFRQSYPSSKRQKTLNMFTFATKSDKLMVDLVNRFPAKYMRYENLTDQKASLQDYFPDDYGTYSPVTNNGAALDLRSFDYIGAPKAWDYTTGNGALIGISDAKIDTTDVDFKFKTTFLQDYYTFNLHNLTVSEGNIESFHGTGVTAVAAGQGDNGHGMTGVCYDCGVVATSYRLWTSPYTQYLNYDGLLQLAQAGVQVINMSWRVGYTSSTPPNLSEQDVIDEIHDMNVVLVAGAGNEDSYDYTGWSYYGFPASYNHVISVTGVNYKNEFGEETQNISPYGEVSMYVKDMLSFGVVTNYQGNGPYGFYGSNSTLTTNDLVDILAPGLQAPRYSAYLYNFSELYSNATSLATPYVTGTIALMYSLNSCLINDEAEDVLQLTAKNIEALQGNEPWIGRSGAGKMETGDAVEFVDEMMDATGNAVINGQDFYRFDFKLEHINNELTIDEQIFRNANTSDFTARTAIDVTNSDFNPTTGFVDLKINGGLLVCSEEMERKAVEKKTVRAKKQSRYKAQLYPNPNQGFFSIATGLPLSQPLDLTIFDVTGKQVFHQKTGDLTIKVNNFGLQPGMYIVKLSGNNYSETFKFIKL